MIIQKNNRRCSSLYQQQNPIGWLVTTVVVVVFIVLVNLTFNVWQVRHFLQNLSWLGDTQEKENVSQLFYFNNNNQSDTILPLTIKRNNHTTKLLEGIRNSKSDNFSWNVVVIAESDSASSSSSFPKKNETMTYNTNNITTISDVLPSVFANNRLYLQGIRFTTSFDPMIPDLHVDLFGFPIDKVHCRSCRTMLTWDQVQDNVTMFCQIINHSPLVSMKFIPSVTLDKNAKRKTFIWRCNVTNYLNKPQLLNLIENNNSVTDTTVTVQIWMEYQQEIINKIATFNIPLDTGVVGNAGPIIRGNNNNNNTISSYFQQPPVPAGLCVAIFRKKPLTYLKEFVQHHINVGFGSIVIGVRSKDGNLLQTQHLLQKYIDQGVVALANYGVPYTRNVDDDKLQFYTTCLFHHKGITKYSAAWDIDEFWVPPVTQLLLISNNTVGSNGSIMESSSRRAGFVDIVRNDPLWQTSPYAKSVSFGETVAAIDQYYSNHGCGQSWCFHIFPSQFVYLKNESLKLNRSTRIGDDFYMRASEYDRWHIKSVANTMYANLGDFHRAGSCFYTGNPMINVSLSQEEDQYSEFALHPSCPLKTFFTDTYGTMHHFWNLLSGRNVGGKPAIVDEYVSIFAPTVQRQLGKNDNITIGNDNSQT